MAKILLVNGSCKEKGCTYTALNEIVSVLEQEGLDRKSTRLNSSHS